MIAHSSLPKVLLNSSSGMIEVLTQDNRYATKVNDTVKERFPNRYIFQPYHWPRYSSARRSDFLDSEIKRDKSEDRMGESPKCGIIVSASKNVASLM